MNLTGGAGVLPEPLARAIVEDTASSVRKLASSVRHEERLNFARAIVVGVVSAYWKELQAVSERRWPLRRLPSDIGLASVPEEIEEQAERIGIAAAGLDVPDAGYAIGVLYTALMPDRFRAWLVSARTLCDGAVVTVFDGRRPRTGTMGAGCRMAVSQLTATGRSPDPLSPRMRCAWSHDAGNPFRFPFPPTAKG